MDWIIEYLNKQGKIVQVSLKASEWRLALIEALHQGRKAGLKYVNHYEASLEQNESTSLDDTPLGDDIEFVAGLFSGRLDESAAFVQRLSLENEEVLCLS